MIREYSGNTRLKVNVYRFLLSDFFEEEEIKTALKDKAATTVHLTAMDL